MKNSAGKYGKKYLVEGYCIVLFLKLYYKHSHKKKQEGRSAKSKPTL